MNLLLLNAAVITADGTYTVRTIDGRSARYVAESSDDVESYVGHDATAQVFSDVLEIPVAVNRGRAAQKVGQSALALVLADRQAEGAILDRPQMELCGYTFKLIHRIA